MKIENKRKERRMLAEIITISNENKYENYINVSAKISKIYKEVLLAREMLKNKPSIKLVNEDIIASILSLNNISKGSNILALNFTSYKNLGGNFIKGTLSHEANIYKESFLYNVLIRYEEELYRDRYILYTPNILFERITRDNLRYTRWCDVINTVYPDETSLENTLHSILSIAKENKSKSLIIGSYDYKLFKLDPYKVYEKWKELLDKYDFGLEQVVFTVPDKTCKNYKAFSKVFQ